MSQASPKLEVKNLYKVFGKDPEGAVKLLQDGAGKEEVRQKTGSVVGVSDVSFDVAPGEIFVVMGLSGSGKSTLIRCINRLISPTRGQILIDGEDLTAMNSDQLRETRLGRMSMVFQHFALFPHMTVAENVAFGLKIRGANNDERREKALESLKLVGLEEWADSPPSNLSGGMQQRVGLARGLAVDPEILLMDEPFSALDPLIRRDMQLELLELQRSIGNSIVFITHDLHEALVLGHHVAIMKDGRFVQVGTPEEIVIAPEDEYVAEFTRDVDRGRVLKVGSIAERVETLALGSGSPEAVEKRMRQSSQDAIYVVDDKGRPVGLLTRRALAEVNGREARNLDDVMVRDVPSVRASTLLIHAYARCSRDLPLAVVDEQGRVTGVVTPAVVLDALASGDPSDDAPVPGRQEERNNSSPRAASG